MDYKQNRFLPAWRLFFVVILCSKTLPGKSDIPAAAGQKPSPKAIVNTKPPVEKISKQRADELYAKLPTTDPWEKTPDASTLAWGESATLRALVDLYEGTGDAKYLAEVARRGDRLLSHRDDKRGVADGSGKSRPAWSMASKYVVAEGKILDAAGKPVIEIRSTPSAYNNLSTVEVIPDASGNTTRFSVRVNNSHFKREELFSDLSLNPKDERFAEKIVNDPMAPYSARPGKYTEKSNLIQVKVTARSAKAPVNQTITLKPIPVAFMGYLGIIYDPMLRFAEIVKKDKELTALIPAANRFIQAAEESYADATKRLWRQGSQAGEGYYLTCEKGESFPADNVGAPFNFQGRHVCAQLALYRLTGKKEYRARAESMLRHFKNRLNYDTAKDLYVWYYWFEPMTTTGWTPKDNLSANVKYFAAAPNMEDASHGVLDIAMVKAAYQAGLVFTATDLQRFANTFLKHVLMPDRSGVRRKVDGKGEVYEPYFRAMHGWLELANINPQVYESIREAYTKWEGDDLGFCAALLKWERQITARAATK